MSFIVGILLYSICIFLAGKITNVQPAPIRVIGASAAGGVIGALNLGIIGLILSILVMFWILKESKGDSDTNILWTIVGAAAIHTLVVLPFLFKAQLS